MLFRSQPGRRKYFNRAHLVVLQHLEVTDPWLQTHKSFIRQTFKPIPRKKMITNDQITREDNAKFAEWFGEKLTNKPLQKGTTNARLIFALANGPACNLATYQAYDINGYTFYMENKDKTSNYQKAGVTMMFEDEKGTGQKRFYERIEEIWELNYAGLYKKTIFRVRWAKSVEQEQRYFTTMIIPPSSQKLTDQNEPWVFAKDVDQCFNRSKKAEPCYREKGQEKYCWNGWSSH